MSPFPSYRHEDRPWGSFDQFTKNELSTVKLLHVAAGQQFSLQKHEHRSEFWRVVSGSGTATLGTVERAVEVADELMIPAHTLHRLLGGESGITVLEISFGPFDEDDITRTADDYGRLPGP